MKNYIFLTGISICFFAFTCKTKNKLAKPGKLGYAPFIVLPKDASKDLKETAVDICKLLESATNVPFRISTDRKKGGIILTKKKEKQLNSRSISRLKSSSRESFLIQSEENQLWIYASRDEALSHGLYYYLEQLGFNWYMPGDLWTIIPKGLKTISINKNEVVIPDFKTRFFFGTGGYYPNPVVDPDNLRKKEWDLWKKRTRMGQEFKMWGHAGQDVNVEEKEILKRHPEYLAEIKGKRVKWERTAKLCISNKNAVKLYANNRIRAYEKLVKRHGPNNYRSMSIGVDPADGANHCTCTPCKKMGSVSDRVFYLANQVAISLRKKYANAHVNLYAYHKHVEVPKIKLEPNVFVTIIPYKYQKAAEPETIIAQWGAKKKGIYIYDYFGMPVWKKDMPTFDFINEMPEKLRFWKKKKIEGVFLESTYSKGAMGPGLFLFSKLGWDINQSERKIMDAFYKDLFQEAAAPMKKIIENWTKVGSTKDKLPFAYSEIEKASKLARKNKVVIERINAYKTYLHYINLFTEYENIPAKNKSRSAKAEELIKYIWSIYPTGMVHTSEIHDVIVTRLEKKNSKITTNWSQKKDKIKKDKWRPIQNINKSQIDDNFKKEKKRQRVSN